MRIRTIKPEFWSSAKMARVPREVRLVFIGLWNEADDDGRLLGSPKRLAGSLFEHDADVSATVMDGWLGQLDSAGMIVRYEVKGTAYIAIPGFGEHQRIDKRWASRLPPPPEGPAQPRASLAQQPASLAEDCAPDMILSGNVFLSEMTPFGEGNTPAQPPAPPPGRAADEVLPAGPAERAEARRSVSIVRSSLREHRGQYAAAGAILGRPQSVDDLLALMVRELPDGRMQTAPMDGRPLRDIWAERYPTLDGKGTPRRKTLAEVGEVLWSYEVDKRWTLDGAGYLAWWTGKMAEEAEKARRAWEAQGGATASDPDRLAGKRRWLELKAVRDVPPFETWLADRWQRGLDRRDVEPEDAPPPQGPSGGTRTSGQTRALGPASPPPTADPFAAVDPETRAPNLTEMMEASRHRRRQTEEQT